jgi:hypothetical protein
MLPIFSLLNKNLVRRARAAALPWALAAALCALAAPPAAAEKSDRSQSMNIEADQLKHDSSDFNHLRTRPSRLPVREISLRATGNRLVCRIVSTFMNLV